MKETKITEKTTKQGIIKMLKSTVEAVTDSNLKERIEYALKTAAKDLTKVTKADLFELAKEVESLTPAPAPMEASLKPKKLSKKSQVVEGQKVEETEEEDSNDSEEPAEEAKPVQKTSKVKKSAPKVKKPEVESIPPVSNVGGDKLPSAKIFPKEIDHPDLGKLIACPGKFTSYAEVLEALNAEKTLYLAAYWTKRHIKEYRYSESYLTNPETSKNGFPFDLDILMAVLPCETMERVFAMSLYTEALYRFDGDDFKPIEDTDPRSGDKFQVRVSNGMEFEIYVPEEEYEG